MILDVIFAETNTILAVDFSANDLQLFADFGEIHEIVSDVVPKYDGTYDVIPSTAAQILQTERKMMTDNVNIRSIPYAEVSNDSNGYTVTIG